MILLASRTAADPLCASTWGGALQVRRVWRASADSCSPPILGVADPARAFIDAPMVLQRTMIDTLMTVTLRRAKQGKKGFDPESVEIAWK